MCLYVWTPLDRGVVLDLLGYLTITIIIHKDKFNWRCVIVKFNWRCVIVKGTQHAAQ